MFIKSNSLMFSFVLSCIFGLPYAKAQTPTPIPMPTTIPDQDDPEVIGGLYPGDEEAGESVVHALREAIEISVEDFNKQPENPVQLQLRDNPHHNSSEQSQELSESGVLFQVGPYLSEELIKIRDTIEQNNILLVSYGATAPGVNGPEYPGLFRVLPDDSRHLTALVDQLVKSGITQLFILRRNDAWGNEMMRMLRSLLQREGIASFDESYNPEADDNNLNEWLSRVDNKIINQQSEGYLPEQVGILVLGYGEIADIMGAASGMSNLEAVRWFGPGVRENYLAISEKNATAFASRVCYTTSTVLPDASNTRFVSLTKQLNFTQDNLAVISSYAAYDAVQIVGRAIAASNITEFSEVQSNIPEAASAYKGLVSSKFNNDGDPENPGFAVWQFKDSGVELIGTYNSASTAGSITLSGLLLLAISLSI